MSTKRQVSHAAFVIWNYNTRGDSSENLQEKHDVAETFFLTTDIINIKASKDKSSPSGNFTIELAPTRNWVSLITPGSWCAILMSNDRDAVKASKADYKSLKMLGRITSCRASYNSDQQTGARNTSFIIEGKDWGQVFENYIYIDPIFRGSNVDPSKSLGSSAILKTMESFFSKKEEDGSFTAMRVGDVVSNLKKIWGPNNSPLALLNSIISGLGGSSPTDRFNMAASGLTLFNKGGLTLPREVAGFMNGAGLLAADANITTIIVDKEGVLKKYDEYDYGDSVNDGVGVPDIAPLLNTNSFWNILNSNINPLLNELVVDLCWDGATVNFGLYRRVKPFCIREEFEGSSNVKGLISLFKNIKRHPVDPKDIVSFNAGTNWRDRINFIEVRNSKTDVAAMSAMIKGDSQIYDQNSIDRDGFKPLPINASTTFYAPFDFKSNPKTEAIKKFTEWRYLLKEWYFNTHTMLNGSIVLVGQDQYIGVGDNIMVPASIFGAGSFSSKVDSTKHFLLAHIESVNHSFLVDANGTRQFFSTIRFVRGIFTDQDGNAIADAGGGLLGAALDTFSASVPGGGGAPIPRALDPKYKDMQSISNDTTANNVTISTSPNNPGGKK